MHLEPFSVIPSSCEKGHLDIVKFLVEKNADINKACDDDTTPLYISCQEGHLDIVKFLVEKNADINKACDDDTTPLYISCHEGYLDTVSYTHLTLPTKA